MPNDYKTRIIETKQMRAGDVQKNLLNPKNHPQTQLSRLDAVLKKFGIVGNLTAYYSERNDGKLTFLNGHARELLNPDQIWPIDITDLNDQEVDELVLYFDPLTSMAHEDSEIMQQLIEQVKTDDINLLAMLDEMNFDFGEPPSLDDLESEHGEPEEDDFWPVIKVKVSPDTFALYEKLVNEIGQEDDDELMRIIFSRALANENISG